MEDNGFDVVAGIVKGKHIKFSAVSGNKSYDIAIISNVHNFLIKSVYKQDDIAFMFQEYPFSLHAFEKVLDVISGNPTDDTHVF